MPLGDFDNYYNGTAYENSRNAEKYFENGELKKKEMEQDKSLVHLQTRLDELQEKHKMPLFEELRQTSQGKLEWY